MNANDYHGGDFGNNVNNNPPYPAERQEGFSSRGDGSRTSQDRRDEPDRDRRERDRYDDRSRSSRDRRDSGRRRSRSRESERDRDYRSSSHRDSSSHRESSSRGRDNASHSTRSRSRTPPRETKRKRKSLWDKPPTGFETGQVQIPTLMIPTPTSAGAMNPHQQKQARRLYVGNIPPNISDSELSEFFNAAMYTAGVTVDGSPTPVSGIQMNREKAFAFVEFHHLEDATAGMSFDGISLHGYSLKVRRPTDYKPIEFNAAPPTDSNAPFIPHIVSTNVQEGPNKIYIGGLPGHLNEEQVKELLFAFGQLKSFNLVKDSSTGKSKGFAFFDYLDPSVTDRACASLNGMKIGDKTILVQRAALGARNAAFHNLLNLTSESEPALNNPTALNYLNLQMPVAAATALLGLSINTAGVPTRVLQLMNIASRNELLREDEYDDIVADIKEECQEYGNVQSIVVPIPQKPDPEKPDIPTIQWGVGRAFIEFATKEQASKAQVGLGGRKFGGRAILAGFYDEQRYREGNFQPNADEEREYAEDFKRKQEARLASED